MDFNNLTHIEVGKKFPYNVPAHDTVLFDMSDSGGLLLIHMKSPSPKEIEDIRKGNIKVALSLAGECLFFMIKLGSFPWQDAAYNVHLSNDLTELQTPGPTEGYGLQIILVDISTSETKVLRLVGLPNRFSQVLKKQIDKQREMPPVTVAEHNAKVSEIYARYSPKQLLDIAIVQQNLSDS